MVSWGCQLNKRRPHNVTGIDSSLSIHLADPSPRWLGVRLTGALVTTVESSDHPEDRVCLGVGGRRAEGTQESRGMSAPSNTESDQFTAQSRVTLPGPKAQHLHSIFHFPKGALD